MEKKNRWLMRWTYLFSADIHVPNSNSPISWTRYQLPCQLDVADSLHLVTVTKHTVLSFRVLRVLQRVVFSIIHNDSNILPDYLVFLGLCVHIGHVWRIRLHYILVSLEQQRSPLPSTNVPHDNAVVRGTWEEQPLDRIPPQGSNAP